MSDHTVYCGLMLHKRLHGTAAVWMQQSSGEGVGVVYGISLFKQCYEYILVRVLFCACALLPARSVSKSGIVGYRLTLVVIAGVPTTAVHQSTSPGVGLSLPVCPWLQ